VQVLDSKNSIWNAQQLGNRDTPELINKIQHGTHSTNTGTVGLGAVSLAKRQPSMVPADTSIRDVNKSHIEVQSPEIFRKSQNEIVVATNAITGIEHAVAAKEIAPMQRSWVTNRHPPHNFFVVPWRALFKVCPAAPIDENPAAGNHIEFVAANRSESVRQNGRGMPHVIRSKKSYVLATRVIYSMVPGIVNAVVDLTLPPCDV
jgi:hypothetical protein